MSQVVVVDTSIAIKWVRAEPDSPVAEALLDEWIDRGLTILAPVLLAYEVANALHQRVRSGEFTLDEAKQSLTKLLLAGPTLDISPDVAIITALSVRAMELAHQCGLPATYDSHYLALAEREGCEYWTADARLWNAVNGKLGGCAGSATINRLELQPVPLLERQMRRRQSWPLE